MVETCVEEGVELAVYLVLSDIIHQNGCCLWVSPHGGVADIEQIYEDRGPFTLVPVSGMSREAMQALTERQRDTEAELPYSNFADAVREAYQAGLDGKSRPAFEPEWPEYSVDLEEACTVCLETAHEVGSKHMTAR